MEQAADYASGLLALVRYPVELRPPPGFRPDAPETWPRIPGRLEWVGGRLLLMPPCGDTQQTVAFDVVAVLSPWVRAHPEFEAGGNEAGMMFAGEVRGAEAAIWRLDALGDLTGGYRRVPPILAVEVTGQYEGEVELRRKADWYLEHGVSVVWLVLAETEEVLVLAIGSEYRLRSGDRIGPHAELPGLEPAVDDFFVLVRRQRVR